MHADHICIAGNSFPQFQVPRQDHFADSGNDVGLFKNTRTITMVKKLLGAAAMAAVALGAVPAHAAKMGMGCSGANMAKAESAVETMADGDGKWAAAKEMAAAQDSMLSGKMGMCGAHLSKAMHETMGK